MPIKRLYIEGMHCASCVHSIESAVSKVRGVDKVVVNLASSSAKISFAKDESSMNEVIQAIHKLGYRAKEAPSKKKSSWWLYVRTGISILGALPLLWAMIFSMPNVYQFWISFVVQVVGGYCFYITSYYAIKSRNLSMEVLVALGTTVAFVYSFVIYIFSLPGHLYFETSAVLIALILLGQIFEDRAKRRANSGIQALYSLKAGNVEIIRNGAKKVVPIEEITAGDEVIVKMGEKISVDGEIIQGESSVDESLLTGESVPVFKQKGDFVIAGSLNGDGVLKVVAQRASRDSRLQHIIALVEEALSSKPKVARLIDQVVGYFVPVVLVISIVTFILWVAITRDLSKAIESSIAALIIACPCAMGLATPVVIMVAVGILAKKGILVKDFDALMEMRELDELVVDKTGTVTEGKVHVVEIKKYSDDPRVIDYAKGLARYSTHPLSSAILSAPEGQEKDLSEIQEVKGYGLLGKVGEEVYYLGSRKWMEKNRVEIAPEDKDPRIQVYLACGQTLLAIFYLQDHVRTNAFSGVKELKELGVKLFLLSGDRTAVVASVARELEIDAFKGEVSPEEKGEIVESKVHQGKVVGMMGDGVNDAIALAKASLGIGVFSGTDVALDVAGIGLTKNDLRQIPFLMRFSKKTRNKLWQNIFFAFIYNAVGIPIAAFGLLNPMIAGAAMALSSISVVTNALRLRET